MNTQSYLHYIYYNSNNNKASYNRPNSNGYLLHMIFDSYNNKNTKKLKIKPNKLIIITGYLGKVTLFKELNKLPFKSIVIWGMCGSKIGYKKNKALLNPIKKFIKHNNKVKLRFATIQIHSKMYIWMHNTKILKALVGSANFSENALLYYPFREILMPVIPPLPKNRITESPQVSSVKSFIKYHVDSDIKSYLNIIFKNITCKPPKVQKAPTKKSKIKINKNLKTKDRGYVISSKSVALPLFSFNNSSGRYIPSQSNLNWGFSNNGDRTHSNDAAIRIPRYIIKQNQQVIPPYSVLNLNKHQKNKGKKSRLSPPVYVTWDDNTKMNMSFEGDSKPGSKYPKRLTSFETRSKLGIYLRKRLRNKPFNEPIKLGKQIKKMNHWHYVILTLLQPGAYFAELI